MLKKINEMGNLLKHVKLFFLIFLVLMRFIKLANFGIKQKFFF